MNYSNDLLDTLMLDLQVEAIDHSEELVDLPDNLSDPLNEEIRAPNRFKQPTQELKQKLPKTRFVYSDNFLNLPELSLDLWVELLDHPIESEDLSNNFLDSENELPDGVKKKIKKKRTREVHRVVYNNQKHRVLWRSMVVNVLKE
ncbi:hypothetical protein HELRODRAFT_160320 [Helobdella robusta]|uniref:Uncharacterized protein n=1 Tax=Helobdella robusta TaxID=6412 RepID=T1EQ34_HELRO|nr:hypothetical protein HELRODRAFT_160320 [Helobdella robusta]ESO06168.1 hypothetical protein HELRODRAFT_160320 [Helobdella robusta]